MRPLQAYDYLFTVTSASENRAVTTDQRIWVWAQPLGRAHTHQLRGTPPSALQRRVSGQDVGNLLARRRVGALVQDGDAGGDDAAVDGGQDLVPRGLTQALLCLTGTQESRVHEAGDQAGHERVARAHGVHQLNVQRVDDEHVTLGGSLDVDAPGASRAQDQRRAGLRPLADDVLDGAARPSDGRTEAFGAPDPSGPPGATEVLDAGSYGGSWGAQAAGANQADANAGHSGLQGATEVLPDAGHAPGGYTAPDGATQVLPGGSGEVQPTQVAPTGASGTPTEVLSAPVPANPAVIPPARQPAWPGQPQGQQYGPAPVQPGAYPPGWGERFGGPIPGAETEVPPWMRPAPSAWFLVALAGAVLCALAVRLPLVAVVAYSFLAFVLAVFGTAHADLNNRRLSRGGKYSGEGLGVVLRLPWVVVKCALAQIVSVAIAAVFGAGAVWGLTYLVPEQPLVATLAGGAVTFFFAWMTGTNRSARLGARELFAAIAPTASYRAFWALALLGLAAFTAVYAMEASAPDWTPLPEAPIFART